MKLIKSFLFVLMCLGFKVNAQGLFFVAGSNFSTINENYVPTDIRSGDISGSLPSIFAPDFFIEERTKQMGFHIGVGNDFKIKDNFYFSPQVQLALKKEKYVSSYSYPGFNVVLDPVTNVYYYINGFTSETQIENYYLDFPLNLKYSLPVGSMYIDILGGPFASVKLIDASETVMVPALEPYTVENNFSNRLDYGFNLGMGLSYKALMINLTADLGFYRRMTYPSSVERVRNSALKLSVGYRI